MSAYTLMMGNEAIARGAIEAGVRYVSCYPGTPSSEVVEALIKMRETGQDCSKESLDIEYSVNEKVALEVGCGAALAGSPCLVTMKHVGLNVAADPLFTAAYTGMPGGLVILSADDPGCHSSQNEQDNRYYSRAAHLPCFEPASAEEARLMTKAAFKLARELQQPVLLRTTTRVSHLRGPVANGACCQYSESCFKPTANRFVPVPAVAKIRHKILLEQMAKAEETAENSEFCQEFIPEWNASERRYGVIASGVARAYLADALKSAKLEKQIGVLELGMTWPLPRKRLKKFLESCTDVLVLEEGATLLEHDIRSLGQNMPVRIAGKDGQLSECGEYSASSVLTRLENWLGRDCSLKTKTETKPGLPVRPPNLCPGCGHRSVYYAVRKIFGDNAIYSTDIGCYTLGLLPPLKTADFLVCMGSSVTAGSGYAAASKKPVVAFIGDSTFFHSGITGLANAIFNKHDLLLVILDNGTTAMTGHQPNPGMAQECLGEDCRQLDIGKILDGLGIAHWRRVKAHNLKAVSKALEELRPLSGVRVLLAQEPCLLYASSQLKRKRPKVAEVRHQGEAVEKCLADLACPAFMRKEGKLAIDENLCGGCMVCMQIAPDAIGAKALKAG